MIDPGLRGRVALITGANSPAGTGAAMARAFAAQGAQVFLSGFRAPAPEGDAPDTPGEAHYRALGATPLEHVIAEIRAVGGTADGWECDLTEGASIAALFERAEAAFGPVEILVNNAGDSFADTFVAALGQEETAFWNFLGNPVDAASFARNFDLNVRAAALLTAEFARRHVARSADWGRIISVSTAGSTAFPREASYGASKAALEAYTRTAALELAPHGVTANIMVLGPIQTGWISPEMEPDVRAMIPLGRLGTPEDVADVATFLASEQARFLTGQALHVGGGHSLGS